MFSLERRVGTGVCQVVAGLSILLLFVAKSMPQAPTKLETLESLDVCQLLEELTYHNNKYVKVRGILVVDRHSFALYCESGNKRETREPGTALALNLVRAGSSLVKTPIDGLLDRESISRMETLLCFLHNQTTKEAGVKIKATFEGELRVPDLPRSAGPPVLPRPRIGVGHLGAFPAELVYRRAYGIEIRQVEDPEP